MLVSCICPTMPSRRDFLKRAIKSFVSQDYPEREMVVIDSGAAAYVACNGWATFVEQGLPWSETLGEKRNVACGLARGEIIIHWDDDDRSTPDRISHQVGLLLQRRRSKPFIDDLDGPLSVIGYRDLLVEETRGVKVLTEDGWREAGRFWRWNGWAEGQAAGTSLCYRKEWWRGHPFKPVDCGEDSIFYADAHAAGVAMAFPGGDRITVLNHRGNASGRLIGGVEWEELPGNPNAQ